MPPAIGAALGFVGFAAAGGFAAATGTITVFGLSLGLLECMSIGGMIGSLFAASEMDLSAGSTPNYPFGSRSNTKSQLLPIPISYGTNKVTGNIFLQRFYSDARDVMDVFIGMSEGSVSRIYDVFVDDHNMTGESSGVTFQKRTQVANTNPDSDREWDVEWVDIAKSEYDFLPDNERRMVGGDGVRIEPELKDCECRVYLGEPDQPADPLSLGGLTYGNTAYVALHLKTQEGLSGNPVISAMVDGIKVRTSVSDKTKHFTRNPAWIIYDFLSNQRYGLGIPEEHLDIYSFDETAAFCDELVDGNPRYTLDIIIDSQKPGIDHLNDMLACFGGYIICDTKIRLRCEHSENIAFELTADNIIKGSFQWWQKAVEECYNRVTLSWTDPELDYENVTSVYQNETDIKTRGIIEQSYTMRGITRKEQADRIGSELLYKSQRIKNVCSLGISIKDSGIEIGDVGRIKLPRYTGWEDKLVRVLSAREEGKGEIQLTCIEYSGDVYDGPVLDGGKTQNYPVRKAEDITDLVLSDAGFVESDGTFVPAVNAKWRLPTEWASMGQVVSYRLSVNSDGKEPVWGDSPEKVITGRADSTEITITDGLKIGHWVEVKVQGKKKDESKSKGVVGIILVHGDTVAPDKPTSLTATGWFGSIILDWINPTDSDLSHIEVWENVKDDINTAALVGEVKGNSFTRYTSSFQGRFFWVRAVDYSGNKSSFNANAGTFGYSDQEKHSDLMEVLLQENPWLKDEIIKIQEAASKSVEELAETIISSNTTLSNHTDDLKRGIAIAEERLTTKIEEGLSAEAKRNLELLAAINDNTALIQQEQSARVTAEGAIAQDIKNLGTKVGDNTALIQQNTQSINGVQAKWSIKTDVNGHVAGIELIGTGESSAMVFNVDSFLVGNSKDPVFAIGVVDGVQRISMRNVYIQDAAISTLKIQHDAVTVYAFMTGGGSSSWLTYYDRAITWETIPTSPKVAVTGMVGGRVAMMTFSINWHSSEDYAGTTFCIVASQSNINVPEGNRDSSIASRIRSSGQVVWERNCGGGDHINMSYTEQFEFIPPSDGTWFLYPLWLLGSGGDYQSKWNTYIRSHSLSVFHMKR